MNFFSIFVIVAFFKMASGAGEKVQETPNVDIMSLIKHVIDRLDVMDERTERRFDVVNERLNAINQRFDDVEKRFDSVDGKITKLGSQVQELNTHVRKTDMTLREVIKQSQFEQQEIRNNSKSVAEVAEQTTHLSTVINANLNNISQDVREVKKALTEVLPGKSEATPADSCSWLEEHSYCARSGLYWINDGRNSSLKYCNMDQKPVTTTVAPTTAFYTTEPPTTEPVHQNLSCKELKERNPHLKSGTYNITVGNETFEAVCDMESDGGGWLMIGNAVVRKNEEAKEVDYRNIQNDDYTLLGNVTTGHFLLSTKGTNALYDLQPFTEIRFDCHKPYHRRRLDIKTTTNDIIQWFLRRRSLYPEPPSCGTFSKLPNDSSFIGGHCDKWWYGRWNINKMYSYPIGAHDGESGLGYWITLYYNRHYGLLCDDHHNHPNFNSVGEWSFYVR